MGKHVSRRQFLRTIAGAGGVAATADAVAAQEAQSGQGGPRVTMTSNFTFEPTTVTVSPGTTVVWENTSNIAHSVTAYGNEIPEKAEYFASGGPFESEEAARSAYPQQGAIKSNETYKHTFEVEGSYRYFCIPHETLGMKGTVEVTQNPGGGGGGGGGGSVSILPKSAKTLLIVATSALVAVLTFTWAFMKYGGEYGGDQAE